MSSKYKQTSAYDVSPDYTAQHTHSYISLNSSMLTIEQIGDLVF